MNQDNYLPLSYLNAWEYCPRRFYWEYVLGVMSENEHIIMGRYLHENINQPGSSTEGDLIIHRQQSVWSDTLSIHGVIDAVEEKNGLLIPVEYKKGKMAKHLNDHFQVCAAGLCLEEKLSCHIEYGEIFYHGNRRRQKVIFTQQLRNATRLAIQSAHEAVRKEMPLPIDNSRKCQDCSIKHICLPSELKVLRKIKSSALFDD